MTRSRFALIFCFHMVSLKDAGRTLLKSHFEIPEDMIQILLILNDRFKSDSEFEGLFFRDYFLQLGL